MKISHYNFIIYVFFKQQFYNKKNIKYIQKCRSNDMAAIEYVVNQCKQGKNIVFVMPKNNSTEQLCSTLPENAIKTVFGFQDVIYKRQTDFSGINENSIVILPSWQINKTDQLNNVSVMNDFYLYFKDAFIGIYVPKNKDNARKKRNICFLRILKKKNIEFNKN